MKTLNKIKFFAFALIALLVGACAEDETLVGKVREGVTNGAILRTVKVNQGTFNFFDTTQKWSVTVEEQDAANGTLLQEVKLLVKHTTGGVAGSEVLVKTFPASAFVTGTDGYPRATLEASLDEVLAVLSKTIANCLPTDVFAMRLELVLTDGRTFTNTNSSSSLSSAFFRSPFLYSAQFFCPLADASLFDGDYEVVTDDWEDYGVGDVVPVEFDSGYKFRIMSTNNPYLVNTGSYMEVTVNPANGAVTVVGSEPFNYGSPTLYTVSGTGTVGTCTGDISLLLKFNAFLNNRFILKKQ
jgi:hypothetical protein